MGRSGAVAAPALEPPGGSHSSPRQEHALNSPAQNSWLRSTARRPGTQDDLRAQAQGTTSLHERLAHIAPKQQTPVF